MMSWFCLLRNVCFVAPLAIAHLTIYLLINQYPLLSSRLLPLTILDRCCPFWIWTVWIYFLLILLSLLLPLLMRDWLIFRRMMVAYLLAMGGAVLFFTLLPTHYSRPPIPTDDSWPSAAYRWLVSVDTPECCFPSAHILVPVIACVGLWKENRRLGWCVIFLVAICSLSILTTKQHYVWDLIGGVGFAFMGMVLAERWVDRAAGAPETLV